MEQVCLSQRAKCTLPFLWPSVHHSFPHQLLHVIHPTVISLYIPPSSTHICVSTEQAVIAFNLQACIQNVLFITLSQVTGCPHWRSLWFSSFSSDEYEHSTGHIHNIPNPSITFTSLPISFSAVQSVQECYQQHFMAYSLLTDWCEILCQPVHIHISPKIVLILLHMLHCLMVCNPSMKQTWHDWAHTRITESSLLCGREDGGGVLSSCNWKCTCLDWKITWFWKNKSHVARCKYEGRAESNCEPCQVCPSSHLPTWNRDSHGTEFHKSLHSEFLPEFVSISWFLLNQTIVIDMSHENLCTFMILLCCVELL